MSGHPRFTQLTEEEVKLHDAKNADYAGGGDPLGNFNRVANILSNYPGLPLDNPTVIALIYTLKQFDAVLWMLAKGYEGKVEGIGPKLGDVSIYSKLAIILHEEAK